MARRRSGRGSSDSVGRLGAQQGLGDALMELGTSYFKSQVAAQIEQEREARAEERDFAKQERQRVLDEGRTSQFKIERDADGATWRQGYNKFGSRTADRELASAEDIKQYNYEDEKNKLSLESLVSRAAKDKAEAENLPLKYARETEKHEADMAYRTALTDAADARADRTRSSPPMGAGVNDTDVANSLLGEYKEMTKESGLSNSELQELALASIKTARTQGKDPLDLFRQALPRFIDRRKASKGTPRSGGGLNLGN